MGEALAIEKPPLGDFFGNRRGRRRNRRVSPYRIKEKSLRRRRTASGPHVDYNARLYDPALGRFLSVDPMIAHPGSTQSINPYSYVENNPLNKTDPTGEALVGVSPCGVLGDMCGMGGWGVDLQNTQKPQKPAQAPAAGATPSAGITSDASAKQIANHVELGDKQHGGFGQAFKAVFGKVTDAFNAALDTLKTGAHDFSSGFSGADIMDPGTHFQSTGYEIGDATAYILEGLNQGAKYTVMGLLAYAPGGEEADAGIMALDAESAVAGAEETGTAISTFRYTQEGENLFHYSFRSEAKNFTNGLRPGGFATDVGNLSGEEARSGLSLSHDPAPNAVYRVSPRADTLIRVNPITRPRYGQPGGLPEFQFPNGTGPGTVSEPWDIP